MKISKNIYFAIYIFGMTGVASGTTFTVTTLEDVAIDLTDTVVTLRDAVAAANGDIAALPGGTAGSGADTIEFDASLSSGELSLSQGELAVSESLTIDGSTAQNLTIDGGNVNRLFVLGGANVNTYTLRNLVIKNGNGAGSNERRGGGAIQMFGDRDDILNIENVVLQGHSTNNRVGAAISLVFGTLNIAHSAVVSNGSGQGTIYLQDANCTVSNSTFSGNSSNFGAFWARAGFGTTNLTLTNATISDQQDGVFYSAERVDAVTNVNYRNSLFAQNTNSFRAGGTAGTISLNSEGSNVLSDSTGDAIPDASDILNMTRSIGPLRTIGGSFVHTLLEGTGAIDNANVAFATATDQLNQERLDGDDNGTVLPDIGAYEATYNPTCFVSSTSSNSVFSFCL